MADNFSPAGWKHSLSDFTPRSAFAATDAATAKRWQATLRRKFSRLLGSFPDTPTTPEVKVLERMEFKDHTRSSLSFESRPGLTVFAYLLQPKTTNGKRPALLCLHGHGYGVDALIGLDEKGKPRTTPDYHNNFALEAVKRGYVVMAPEILGFGRRREGEFEAGSHASSCQTLSGAALMLGETMAGWRVFDAMRSLDVLQNQPDVDAKRIGTIGISGGGLNALFLAALDKRIKATVVSGYLNTWQACVMGVPHCIDNFIPGLAREARMSDIAGLIAPRALWCENGSRDNIFPVAAFQTALDETRDIYKVFGAPKNVGGEVFEGEHQFHGAGAWPFLEKHL